MSSAASSCTCCRSISTGPESATNPSTAVDNDADSEQTTDSASLAETGLIAGDEKGSTSNQTHKHPERVCGLPKPHGKRPVGRTFVYNDTNDYEQKYPEDAYGDEMGPNARVWRVYLDEAQKADAEMVEGWRDTTDALLVFAGLFSAVVTTFVTSTSTALQTDYAQITASLLLEQIALMRATGNGLSVNTVPSLATGSPAFLPSTSPSSLDRWVNGLWFISLSFGLSAAFIAVLVKQWIQHYVSVVSGTSRDQARIRQFRYLGIKRWYIPEIIAILPFLLHAALFLYLVGLVILLIELDIAVSAVVLTITATAFIFYLSTNLIPIQYPDCPYRTPLSSHIIVLSSRIKLFGSRAISSLVHKLGFHSPAWLHCAPIHRGKTEEVAATEKQTDRMDAEALIWLHSTSSNPTIKSVVFQSLSGLRLGFKEISLLKNKFSFGWSDYSNVLISIRDQQSIALDSTVVVRAERVVRAYTQIGPRHNVLTLYPRWKVGLQTLLSLDDPKFTTLACCCLPAGSNPNTNPGLLLEQYTYASKELHPVVWCRLLLRSLQQAKHPLSDIPWSHAFKVLDNFFSSMKYRDTSDSMISWGEKCAAMFQYLHAFLLQDPEERTRIESIPCDFSIALPRIISVIASVIDGLSACGEWIQYRGLLDRIMAELKELEGYLYEEEKLDSDAVKEAARHLHEASRTLVESKGFLQDVPAAEDRVLLFEILFNRFFLACWPRLAPIHWTSALMKSCLGGGCLSGTFGAAASTLNVCFQHSEASVYRLFREHDGLSCIVFDDPDLCRYFWHLYCGGILDAGDHPGTDLTQEREKQLDYLMQPQNILKYAQLCTILPNVADPVEAIPDVDQQHRRRLLELFDLRPTDPVWSSVVSRLLDPTRQPQIYRLSLLASQHDDLRTWRRSRHKKALVYVARLLLAVHGRSIDADSDGEMLFEYVHGRDVEDDMQDALHVDGLPMYAPYVIPFTLSEEQRMLHSMTLPIKEQVAPVIGERVIAPQSWKDRLFQCGKKLLLQSDGM